MTHGTERYRVQVNTHITSNRITSYLIGMITVDTKDTIKTLEGFKAQMSAKEYKVAINRSIKRTLQTARTLGAREIRAIYTMPYSNALKSMKIKTSAGRGSEMPVGALMASSSYTPISQFNVRQMTDMGSYTKLKKGVLSTSLNRKNKIRISDRRKIGRIEVQIKKGQRRIIASAFFMTKGRSMVFARGKYQEGNFGFGKERMPISPLKTVSVFKAITDQKVMGALKFKLESSYNERLLHEFRFILNKVKDQPSA